MPIYVGTFDRVNVYDNNADGDAMPIRSIHGPSTGLDGVADIVVDASENLYVGNAASSTITIYAPTADGDAAPARVIAGPSTRLGSPGSLAIDSTGNLYVLNTGGIPANRTITVYGPGASGNAAPIRELTGIQVADGNLNGIAIDWSDNLYLSEDLPEIISVFRPGANGTVAPIRTISGGSTELSVPVQMAFDASDNLYVSNGVDVLVFAPGASGNIAPIRKISGPSTGISDDFDLAVDATGLVYVGNFPPDFTSGSVTVYEAGANGDAAPIRTITGVDTELGVPSGGIAVPRLIFGTLESLTVFPATVTGGDRTHGTVTLKRAVTQDTVIGLAALEPGTGLLPLPENLSSVVSVPESVTVSQGGTIAHFDIMTTVLPRGTTRTATIIANARVTKHVTLTITS